MAVDVVLVAKSELQQLVLVPITKQSENEPWTRIERNSSTVSLATLSLLSLGPFTIYENPDFPPSSPYPSTHRNEPQTYEIGIGAQTLRRGPLCNGLYPSARYSPGTLDRDGGRKEDKYLEDFGGCCRLGG